MTRFRITLKGAVFTALALAVGVAAALRANNYLFLLAAFLLSLLATDAFYTWLMPRRLSFRRTLPPSAMAETPLTYTLEITNLRPILPAGFIRIEDAFRPVDRRAFMAPRPVHITRIQPRGRVRTAVVAVPPTRGWFAFGPLHITCRFPPGLFQCTRTIELPDRILVTPAPARLEREVVNPHISSRKHASLLPFLHTRGDEEFSGLREYRPGDNPRRIDWKMSSRIPGLRLLREYEDARVRDAFILLETTLKGRTETATTRPLERAIAFSAALADLLMREQHVVTFRAFAPELLSLRLSPSAGALDELLHHLALLRPTRLQPLTDLVPPPEETDEAVRFIVRISSTPLPHTLMNDRTVVLTPGEIRAMIRGDAERRAS